MTPIEQAIASLETDIDETRHIATFEVDAVRTVLDELRRLRMTNSIQSEGVKDDQAKPQSPPQVKAAQR